MNWYGWSSGIISVFLRLFPALRFGISGSGHGFGVEVKACETCLGAACSRSLMTKCP